MSPLSDARRIRVEVVYALPERQRIVTVRLSHEATVADAVEASGLATEFPGIDPGGETPVGIFGRKCRLTDGLRDGDRVELYRPLKADPKEIRRELAAQGKTMGRGKSGED